MGVSYLVFAIAPAISEWLVELGVEVPRGPSRMPSPNQLRAELARLDGYRVEWRDNLSGGWDAEIVDAVRGYQGKSTTIWITEIEDPDAPHDFSFHKGDPE